MILKLFGRTTAGKCLNAVKRDWGCIGENLSKTPGEHLYKTVEGDTVSMASKTGGLEIRRHIAPENMAALQAGKYKGKLFKIINYLSPFRCMDKAGNGSKFYKKFRWIHKFANQDENLVKKTKVSDLKGYNKDEKTGIISEFISKIILWKRLHYQNNKLVKID